MEVKPGGIFRRFLAYLLDIIICSIAVAFIAVLYLKAFTSFSFDGFFNFSWLGGMVGKWTGRIVLPLYLIYFEQTKWEATPGKTLFKLKVVNSDGSRLSLYRSCLRVFLFKIIGYLTAFLVYSQETKHVILKSLASPSLYNLKLSLLAAPGYFTAKLIALVWVCTMIFTKQKTGVYEMLSGTKVICQR
jgi:uncharacterized RDD family membrane protein YckC